MAWYDYLQEKKSLPELPRYVYTQEFVTKTDWKGVLSISMQPDELYKLFSSVRHHLPHSTLYFPDGAGNQLEFSNVHTLRELRHASGLYLLSFDATKVHDITEAGVHVRGITFYRPVREWEKPYWEREPAEDPPEDPPDDLDFLDYRELKRPRRMGPRKRRKKKQNLEQIASSIEELGWETWELDHYKMLQEIDPDE
jgi:hypothetical protein